MTARRSTLLCALAHPGTNAFPVLTLTTVHIWP